MVVAPRPFYLRPDGGERRPTGRLPRWGSGGEAGVPGSPSRSPPPPGGGGGRGAEPAACFPQGWPLPFDKLIACRIGWSGRDAG